ncbi:tyrosine--tRNA ligase [Candidatus Saccharibacteria bacterium RIFCSPHIGHO2_02_FULL_47_12]|nr:MAG: tyrosine--tRNA ligase [Candidatus Saccharibacteria bacterium RIFCSPHIGHO2_02_FULL_47_12]
MSKSSTDKETIDELLSRSIDTVYPSKEKLKRAFESGKQLTVYVGIDPTADYVHLGHSTNYIILRRMHSLGHKIIVLVGDFTAMIGDPSDKTSARVHLSKDQVKENLKTFKSQIGKILDFDNKANPIEFKFNGDWLSKLTFEDSIELASNFTVQQMIERDAFQKRLKEKKPLFVHEFFYPLMQGYDSVAMDVDVEIGGTDQTFNMLAGRTLLKRYKNKEKFVITTTLLENPVTREKLMSKSLGTGIALNDEPNDMFGKVMSLPDEAIIQVFTDCTLLQMQEIEKLNKMLEDGTNPRDVKLRLGREIVGMYHGPAASEVAQEEWEKQFSHGEIPTDMPYYKTKQREQSTFSLLTVAFPERILSLSEARRLVEQGGVKLNNKVITDSMIRLSNGDVLQVGKRHFIRISFE